MLSLALLTATLLTQSVSLAGKEPALMPTNRLGPDFFSYSLGAPASGAQCLNALITSDQADAITCTRASTAMCTKADGTMVSHSADRCRVQANGILREWTRTNEALRSQEIDNAAWTPLNGFIVAPVRTANAAVAPDGTTTAEQIDFPSSMDGIADHYSYLFSVLADNTSTRAGSIYLKGCSGSGTIWLWGHTGAAVSGHVACAYTSGAWSRCSTTFTGSIGSGGDFLVFGIDQRIAAQTTTSTQCVYAWGAQAEVGAFPTSYIPTAGTTVARSTDEITTTLSQGIASRGCMSASVTYGATYPAAGGTDSWLNLGGQSHLQTYSATNVRATDGTNQPTITIASMLNGTTAARAHWSAATGFNVTSGATTNSTAFTGSASGTNVLTIGGLVESYFEIRAIRANTNAAGCQ